LEIVQTYPQRLAIKTRTHSFSFGKLNHLANCIAHAILQRDGNVGVLVALVLTKDAPMLAAMLGVFKAGKAYLPVDPPHPFSRSRYIVDDTVHGSSFPIIVLLMAMELTQGKGELINVLGYADLCRSLGPEQPFYAFQSIGLDGVRVPLESIEMIAEVYVAEIHKVQPRGPYAEIRRANIAANEVHK
jgi:hypothetical protein